MTSDLTYNLILFVWALPVGSQAPGGLKTRFFKCFTKFSKIVWSRIRPTIWTWLLPGALGVSRGLPGCILLGRCICVAPCEASAPFQGVVLIIWVIILFSFLSKLTVPAAKGLINKGLPAFCRAFAARTINFDKSYHNNYQKNDDVVSEIFKGLQPLFPARIDIKSAKKSQKSLDNT